MTTLELAWLAGLLEGEGSFGSDSADYPSVQITMTDRDVISRVARAFGSTERGPYKTRTPAGNSGVPVWRAHAYGNRAAGWMMTLYPLMGERRKEKIRIALAAWKTRSPKHQKAWKAARGNQTPAACHPERRVHGFGKCFNCYQRERRANARRAAHVL
jgi:hypothetical protein